MNSILIHTSNIINWKSIKNNPRLTSTDEILRCSIQVMKCVKIGARFADRRISDLELECSEHKDVISENKSDLRLSVKLFLIGSKYHEIQKHLAQIYKYLEFNELDSLILSIAPSSTRAPICMADIYEMWSKLEFYVKTHRIHQLGVCDFTLEQLKDMWQNVEIKPTINQIHAMRMCSVSQELKDFASDNHIQLLSHNDRPVTFRNQWKESETAENDYKGYNSIGPMTVGQMVMLSQKNQMLHKSNNEDPKMLQGERLMVLFRTNIRDWKTRRTSLFVRVRDGDAERCDLKADTGSLKKTDRNPQNELQQNLEKQWSYLIIIFNFPIFYISIFVIVTYMSP